MTSKRIVPDIWALMPKEVFVGVSLILRAGELFLYGIRRPRAERTGLILELTGIGGAVEPTDASLTEGVLREAQEEIGCPVRLLPCQDTLVVQNEGHISHVQVLAPEQPIAVVLRHYHTLPREPWGEPGAGRARSPESTARPRRDRSWLIVFLAELAGDPRPVGELPGLIWLLPEQIVETARHDVPLLMLLNQGAELIEDHRGSLPRPAFLRLTDSQEALVLALGPDATRFYRRLGN